MPASGGRDNGQYGDDAAVFKEATPATRELIETLIHATNQAKVAAEDLKNAITTLQQQAQPQVVEHKREGHGAILYSTGDELLADVDRELLKTPLWADLPSIDTICGGLPGMKSTGMAKSTLRDNLLRFALLPRGGTLKRWLIDRKAYLDEQRQPNLFSHLAATFIVIVGCLGELDPSNMPPAIF